MNEASRSHFLQVLQRSPPPDHSNCPDPRPRSFTGTSSVPKWCCWQECKGTRGGGGGCQQAIPWQAGSHVSEEMPWAGERKNPEVNSSFSRSLSRRKCTLTMKSFRPAVVSERSLLPSSPPTPKMSAQRALGEVQDSFLATNSSLVRIKEATRLEKLRGTRGPLFTGLLSSHKSRARGLPLFLIWEHWWEGWGPKGLMP